MNTNPKATRILCYGDSNTHGRDAKRKVEQGIKTRYPIGVRWTSQLQIMLGDGYEVIEEGLGGRTTNIDDPDSFGKNGLTYLKPCLESHEPLDIVILMLGTNDFKESFHRTSEEIAEANRELIKVIKARNSRIKIVVVSPITVDETNPHAGKYFGAASKSQLLVSELEKVATEESCEFVNLFPFIKPSKYDGLHIDEEDQVAVAETIYQKIKK